MELAAKQHPREVNFDEPSLELAPMKGQMGSGACGKKEALEKYRRPRIHQLLMAKEVVRRQTSNVQQKVRTSAG